MQSCLALLAVCVTMIPCARAVTFHNLCADLNEVTSPKIRDVCRAIFDTPLAVADKEELSFGGYPYYDGLRIKRSDGNYMRFGRSADDAQLLSGFGKRDDHAGYMRFGRSVDEPSTEAKRFMRFGKRSDDGKEEKRFMRFGKRVPEAPDAEKRFMRFGRAKFEDSDLTDEDKRFMRFGRDPSQGGAIGDFASAPEENKRFMRFGRDRTEDVNAEKRFMRFGRDPAMEEDKRFMRFGRNPEASDTYPEPMKRLMRFGKRFMRFGRVPLQEDEDSEDTEQQTLNDNEIEEGKRFMRFGREPEKKFMKFGKRTAPENEKRFMRFGKKSVKDEETQHELVEEKDVDDKTVNEDKRFMRFGRDTTNEITDESNDSKRRSAGISRLRLGKRQAESNQ